VVAFGGQRVDPAQHRASVTQQRLRCASSPPARRSDQTDSSRLEQAGPPVRISGRALAALRRGWRLKTRYWQGTIHNDHYRAVIWKPRAGRGTWPPGSQSSRSRTGLARLWPACTSDGRLVWRAARRIVGYARVVKLSYSRLSPTALKGPAVRGGPGLTINHG
jgi:hypothetical protein